MKLAGHRLRNFAGVVSEHQVGTLNTHLQSLSTETYGGGYESEDRFLGNLLNSLLKLAFGKLDGFLFDTGDEAVDDSRVWLGVHTHVYL